MLPMQFYILRTTFTDISNILIDMFDFRITHASNSSMKDMDKLNCTIKENPKYFDFVELMKFSHYDKLFFPNNYHSLQFSDISFFLRILNNLLINL